MKYFVWLYCITLFTSCEPERRTKYCANTIFHSNDSLTSTVKVSRKKRNYDITFKGDSIFFRRQYDSYENYHTILVALVSSPDTVLVMEGDEGFVITSKMLRQINSRNDECYIIEQEMHSHGLIGNTLVDRRLFILSRKNGLTQIIEGNPIGGRWPW